MSLSNEHPSAPLQKKLYSLFIITNAQQQQQQPKPQFPGIWDKSQTHNMHAYNGLIIRNIFAFVELWLNEDYGQLAFFEYRWENFAVAKCKHFLDDCAIQIKLYFLKPMTSYKCLLSHWKYVLLIIMYFNNLTNGQHHSSKILKYEQLDLNCIF